MGWRGPGLESVQRGDRAVRARSSGRDRFMPAKENVDEGSAVGSLEKNAFFRAVSAALALIFSSSENSSSSPFRLSISFASAVFSSVSTSSMASLSPWCKSVTSSAIFSISSPTPPKSSSSSEDTVPSSLDSAPLAVISRFRFRSRNASSGCPVRLAMMSSTLMGYDEHQMAPQSSASKAVKAHSSTAFHFLHFVTSPKLDPFLALSRKVKFEAGVEVLISAVGS